MADLDYEASVQPEALPGRPFPRLPEEVTPQQTGAQIGQGLEAAGGVANEVYAQAVRNQVTDAHNRLQQLALSITHDPQTGAFTKQGKDAFGLDQQYLPKYDQEAQKIVESLPEGPARQHAMLAAAAVRNDVQSQLDTHELQQHKEFGVNTAKASVSLAQQAAAANYNHPDLIANNLETVDVSLANLGKQQGWSPEELQEAQHQAHVQFHQGVLTNMLADNKTDMAKAYLDSVRGELKPEEIQTATRAIQAGQVKGVTDKVMGAYQTDTTAGAQQLGQLKGSGLTDEQQAEVIRQVEQRRAELRYVVRQQPQVMRQLATLQDHIADGTAGAGDLAQADVLWHRGALSDDERLSVHRQISRAQAQATSDAQLMAPAQIAYQNGTPMDPSDQDSRRGMDLLFQRSMKGVPPGTSEYTNLAVDMAHRTGIAPESAVSWARANLSDLQNADPKTAAQAADLVTRLTEQDHRGIDRPTIAQASMITAAVRSGTDPAQALRVAQKVAQMSEPERKLLDKKWGLISNPATAVKQNVVPQTTALSTGIAKDPQFQAPEHLWGLVGGQVPQVPSQMQASYDALTQDYYLNTGGDLPQARQLALKDLKKVWGYSEVNGAPQLIPYPPEKFYPGMTPDLIQSDLEAIGHKGARLVYEPGKTDSTRGLAWSLVMPDSAGHLNPVLTDKNQPQGYRLPVEKLQQQKEEEAQKAQVAEDKKAQAGQLEVWRAKFKRDVEQADTTGQY